MGRAPRRPRVSRQPKGMRRAGTYLSTVGMLGGGELHEAAMEIATEAQLIASQWSVTVPASMKVEGDDKVQTISFDAPAAYPAETRARHPLFGDREHWYGPPGRRFLNPAADRRADPAMRKYAKVVDRLCREAGFR